MNDLSFKFQKKTETNNFFSKFLYSIIIKSLLVCIILLGSMIYIKQSDENKEKFKNVVYNNSLSFARIYDSYKKYLGDVIPFKNMFNDNTKIVSKNNIEYSNIKEESNGYILTVQKDYAVPVINEGIVIEVRKDETLNNVVTIQDKTGTDITYGYLTDLNVKLYDYISKGQIVGGSSSKLYLSFKKDGKYLDYDGYI